MRVLVTGATGYVGGRLVPALLDAGHEVRCLARTPAKLTDRAWRADVEVSKGDVRDAASLGAALDGIDAAYYLVHSMDGEGDFGSRDRVAAQTFAEAAAAAGVGQIVYLGGLGHGDAAALSPHLRSRQEVGRILAAGPVPVTELRAATVIGSGSASFEMLRTLVEVLPVMVAPRWIDTRCQPIAVRDVLGYLVDAITEPTVRGKVLEIGGPDVLTYRQMMHVYAEVAGLRPRLILGVPLLTPRLSSLWIGLVTPLPTGLARPLVDSLITEVVVRDDAVRRSMPRELLSFRRAVQLAVQRVQDLRVTTTWSGAELERVAGTVDHAEPQQGDPAWAGGTVFSDRQVALAAASPASLFATVTGIGGERGYPVADVLWELRGFLDKLVGGIGTRRGRRHPDELSVGDALDFWRVEAMEPDRLLRLRAEMRVPGAAWLEFRVEPHGQGSELVQLARFHPRGAWGRAYWYGLLPVHAVIFRRMARRLARMAEAAPGTG